MSKEDDKKFRESLQEDIKKNFEAIKDSIETLENTDLSMIDENSLILIVSQARQFKFMLFKLKGV